MRLREQYADYHAANEKYGASANKFKTPMLGLIDSNSVDSVLDYGCGKGVLVHSLGDERKNLDVVGFDPAVPEFSTIPSKQFDMVTCIDVLEHVPLDELDSVLVHMRGFSERFFIFVSCRLAKAVLNDGSNAHCTVFPPRWWGSKLGEYFDDVVEVRVDDLTGAAFVHEALLTDTMLVYSDPTPIKQQVKSKWRNPLMHFRQR